MIMKSPLLASGQLDANRDQQLPDVPLRMLGGMYKQS